MLSLNYIATVKTLSSNFLNACNQCCIALSLSFGLNWNCQPHFLLIAPLMIATWVKPMGHIMWPSAQLLKKYSCY